MEHNKLRARLQTEEVENNWAISYGDMITLLLGFFVIFFNIKTETINMNLVKKDLDKYFDTVNGSTNGRALAEESKGVSSAPVVTADVANVLQIKSNIEGERILVEFPGVSFFHSASHQLTVQGQKALSDFSKAIDPHLGLFRLVVRGYTDALPLNPRSLYKDNLELSAFRSISAIRFMSKQGVNLEHMRIAGYGESSKSREEKDQDFLKKQRKVVIVIEPLDHTERVPKINTNGMLPEKSIEAVSSASVPKRVLASKAPLGLSGQLKHWFAEVSSNINIQENVDLILFKLDKEISKSPSYQKFVSQLIKLELKSLGYTENRIAKVMLENESQQRERQ